MRLSICRALSIVCCVLLAGPVTAGESNRAETQHLVVHWVDGTPPEAIEAIQTQGEQHYAAIAEMLGQTPPARITILLQGPAEQADGKRGYPHVDMFARIQLYQFGPDWHSYLSPLAHEMVHVFRFQRRAQADWFFEEGFAEFVALRIDESLNGFPWYDSPVTVVAGQWITKGEGIPLRLMQANHQSINLPCKAQTYALRAAFFDYLGATFGDDSVLSMAANERAGDLNQYAVYFGATLDVLEAQWKKALLADYHNLPDADEQARQYREESPIQYMPVCAEGKDF